MEDDKRDNILEFCRNRMKNESYVYTWPDGWSEYCEKDCWDNYGYIKISHNSSGSVEITPSTFLAKAVEYTLAYLEANPDVLKQILNKK